MCSWKRNTKILWSVLRSEDGAMGSKEAKKQTNLKKKKKKSKSVKDDSGVGNSKGTRTDELKLTLIYKSHSVSEKG